MALSVAAHLTRRERSFGDDELIVSKTDTHGRITYANEVFLRVSQFTESELLGAPHSIVRHPEMPRGVFKLLWDTIRDGREVFAYVLNRAKSGDHYWVFAHVTPTFDAAGRIISYHSNRRSPKPAAVAAIQPIYRRMLEVERLQSHPHHAAVASVALLDQLLAQAGVSYEQFIFTL